MPPRLRVRGVSRVCTRRIENVGQSSRAPPVDEEVNSYDGEPFEGNPNSVVGDSLVSVFGDSTPVHYPPSSNVLLGAYTYPYFYHPVWGHGPAQVAPIVNEDTIAIRMKEMELLSLMEMRIPS